MVEVEVTVRGDVATEAGDHAREKLGNVDRLIDSPISHARVVLTQEANPRIERGSRAEGEIGLNGPIIRASVADIDQIGAINQLTQRLERQLRNWMDRRTDIARRGTERERGRVASCRLLRRSGPATFRARRRSARSCVARPSLRTRCTPAEAADEMELLDHDFYLFSDVETGADAVAYHRDDGRLGVIGPSGIGWSGESDGIVHEESRMSGPTRLEDAVAEMNLLDHRFMYFTDAETERGNVIYLRYDGHYGLIGPATP